MEVLEFVPEQRPGQVSVLADAHILGHGDDAVQWSNHDSSGDHLLDSPHARFPLKFGAKLQRPGAASHLCIGGPALNRARILFVH